MAKKLSDLSIKKPSSEAEESVKGGKFRAGLARKASAKKASARSFAKGLARASARRKGD